MTKGDTHNCPSCGTYTTVTLPDTLLMVCRECQGIVRYDKPNVTLPSAPVPPDWSFMQIGTTGQYNKKPFTITGRIRLQLRNDYKNFWCAAYDGDKNLWIMESFGSFSVLQPGWRNYKGDIKKLRATYTITTEDDKKFIGEYVEKCEAVSYEGQVGPWPSASLHPAGFFVVQGSSGNNTAIFTIHTYMKVVDYLVGVKTTPEDLKLGFIHQWNEWR